MRENPKIVNNAIAGQEETNISISIKELFLRIPRRILALQDSFIGYVKY